MVQWWYFVDLMLSAEEETADPVEPTANPEETTGKEKPGFAPMAFFSCFRLVFYCRDLDSAVTDWFS